MPAVVNSVTLAVNIVTFILWLRTDGDGWAEMKESRWLWLILIGADLGYGGYFLPVGSLLFLAVRKARNKSASP